MDGPAVMEADLPLLQGHGDDANLPALRSKPLFELPQVLMVEKANIVQARPAMAPRHHHEWTALISTEWSGIHAVIILSELHVAQYARSACQPVTVLDAFWGLDGFEMS